MIKKIPLLIFPEKSIHQLSRLQKEVASHQSIHAIGTPMWHWYETIDDMIHEKIGALEREIEDKEMEDETDS